MNRANLPELTRVEILQADITSLEVDVVVNAANRSLLGGGGVDGAIHRAAGPDLLEECQNLRGCESGASKMTAGYRLPARYIVHTVGPVWNGGRENEDTKLESCYRSSLELAAGRKARSIAFPNISTGAYRFPFDRAGRIALRAITDFLVSSEYPERVLLVCHRDEETSQYREILNSFL